MCATWNLKPFLQECKALLGPDQRRRQVETQASVQAHYLHYSGNQLRQEEDKVKGTLEHLLGCLSEKLKRRLGCHSLRTHRLSFCLEHPSEGLGCGWVEAFYGLGPGLHPQKWVLSSRHCLYLAANCSSWLCGFRPLVSVCVGVVPHWAFPPWM